MFLSGWRNTRNHNTIKAQKTDLHSNPWVTLGHGKAQAICEGNSLSTSNELSHLGDYQKLRQMLNFPEETTLWTVDIISDSRATEPFSEVGTDLFEFESRTYQLTV